MQFYQRVVTVTTAGTPVQLATTAQLTALGIVGPSAQNVCKLIFQPAVGNTGRIHIGNSAMVVSTGAGVFFTLGKDPGSAGNMVQWILENQEQANDIDPTSFWIDSTVNGEKCWVTLVVE
jgi:hypothetical protein